MGRRGQRRGRPHGRADGPRAARPRPAGHPRRRRPAGGPPPGARRGPRRRGRAGDPWLARRDRPRIGLVAVEGHGGATGALRVREPDDARRVDGRAAWRAGGGARLLRLDAGTRDALVERLRLLADGVAPEDLPPAGAGSERLVLVFRDRAALPREAARARDALTTLPPGARWAAPGGSGYATVDPARVPRIGYAFPGAFTAYPRFGADLLRTVPTAMDALDGLVRASREDVTLGRLYPRRSEAPAPADLMRREAELQADVPFMLGVGTTFAIVYADLLERVTGRPPAATIGYSLGASSMLFATRRWDREHRSLARITASPVFRDELAGDLRTVRRAFATDDGTPVAEVWRAVVVLAPSDEVAARVAGRDRLFVTHVNTPAEVVVAGLSADVEAFVRETGFRTAPSPVVSPLHSPLAEGGPTRLVELHRFPTGPGSDAALLDAVGGAAISPTPDPTSLATRIARSVIEPVDLPALARAVAERVDLVLEAGPGGRARAGSRTRGSPGCARSRPTIAARPSGARGRPSSRSLVTSGIDVDIADLAVDPRTTPPEGPLVGRTASIRQDVAAAFGTADAGAVRGSRADARPAESGTPDADAGSSAPGSASAAAAAAITWEAAAVALSPWWDDRGRLLPAEDGVPGDAGAPADPGAADDAGPLGDDVPPDGSPEGASALVAEGRDALRWQVLEAHRDSLELQHALLTAAAAEMRGAAADRGSDADADAAAPPPASPPPHAADRPTPPGDAVLWDADDLVEFATGRIAPVFGPAYADIDDLAVRVRLPAPPYHFVSRVLAVDGERGRFGRSTITTEYDVPLDAWYLVDGGVPPAVAIEAGQGDLILVAWLGIDAENQGRRVYRLLDSTLIFHGDLPRAGQTLRYEITIERFIRNGPTTLFYFSYRCFADGVLILELTRATAGFFSADESRRAARDPARRRRPAGPGDRPRAPLAEAGRAHRPPRARRGGPRAPRGRGRRRGLRPRARAARERQPRPPAPHRAAADDRRRGRRPGGRHPPPRAGHRLVRPRSRRLVLPVPLHGRPRAGRIAGRRGGRAGPPGPAAAPGLPPGAAGRALPDDPGPHDRGVGARPDRARRRRPPLRSSTSRS
ncbi:hypothetical protein WDV94_05035 [Clavibacter tessellarius]